MSDSIKSSMLNDHMFETDKNCNDDNVHLYAEIADLRKQITFLHSQINKLKKKKSAMRIRIALVKQILDKIDDNFYTTFDDVKEDLEEMCNSFTLKKLRADLPKQLLIDEKRKINLLLMSKLLQT